jgi:cell filamentation protein
MDEIGIPVDRKLFEDNATYVRTALVAYNAYFADGKDFSKKEYLQRIVLDALS